MAYKVKGKIVVITGATSGIGRATAELFAENGAQVICIARRMAQDFYSIPADITDASAVKNAVAEIKEKFGRIDVLINNAGMGISGAVEDTEISDAHAIFELNFFGALNMIKEVVPVMRECGGGTIVNISSVAAELAIPFQSFYSATKAALSSLSSALRGELAPFGIKVCAILPGDVKTDFTSSRRKNACDNPAYGDRVTRSVAVMEKDERNGLPPRAIARIAVKLASHKNPPVKVAGGRKYALFLFLNRILPARLVSYILAKMYA